MKTGDTDTFTTKTGQIVDSRIQNPVLRRPDLSRSRSSVTGNSGKADAAAQTSEQSRGSEVAVRIFFLNYRHEARA
jgi:hypothetical protein